MVELAIWLAAAIFVITLGVPVAVLLVLMVMDVLKGAREDARTVTRFVSGVVQSRTSSSPT